MKVTILSTDVENDGRRVHFRTNGGTAVAGWQGESSPPIGEINVELDVEETIELGRTARLIEGGNSSLSHDDTNVTLRAPIEDQDDDGMAYLRLGDDCLLMMEAEHDDLKGKWIELNVPIAAVKLTPTGA